MVLPAGDEVRGVDGRAWSVKDRAAILAQLTKPIPLDENHSTVHAAPQGGKSPACGWLSDFQFTDAGLEAAVEWTPYGAERFLKKEYRFLSPALKYSSAGATTSVLGTVHGLHSVGLTNHPNFDGLTALNSEESPDMTPEQLKAMTDALTAAIAAGFSALETKLAPATVKEIVKDETVAPNAIAVEALSVAVNTVLDAAVTAGKIAPASREKYAAMVGTSTAGLKSLTDVIATLPVLVGTNAPITLPAKDAPEALTANQKLVCKQLGISEEQFRAMPTGEKPKA